MLSRFLGKKNVELIVFIAYIAIAVGLPFNKIVLSLATMLIVLIAILDFNRTEYLQKFKESKFLYLLLLFIIFHLISLLWTTNYAYFWKDINVKLPFYLLPFALIFKPLINQKQTYITLGFFLFSLLVTSVINYFYYFTYNHNVDIRLMSLFLSHIRYGMMLVVGILICYYWLINPKLKYKAIPILLISWWLIYTNYAEVFSAYLALLLVIICLIYSALSMIMNKKIYLTLFYGITIILICSIFSFIYFFFIENEEIPYPKNEEKTKFGNQYEFYKNKSTKINGTPVYTYICGIELKEEWAKKSNKRIFELNPNGYENYYILIQYMASKGMLKKDAENFKRLTIRDIQNIENGINNCCPEKSNGFFSRLNILKEELYEQDPNGKSVRQRVEYIKAGWNIFKNNLIYGVGPGDLEDEFMNYYKNSNSLLKDENRLRTHNQLLTYFVSFGCIGGFIFLFFLYKIGWVFYNYENKMAYLFLLIVLLSFLNEDTLETQMGATFVGFFIGFFCNSRKFLNHEN
jgi:O-antigen ligase